MTPDDITFERRPTVLSALPRYACLFKTHFWDEFTARQFARLAARAPGADLFIVVDETAGPVAIDGIGHIDVRRIVRLTEATAIAYGLPAATTESSLFWYNVDYPHYIFYDQEPNYDFYLTMEYDAVIETDIDQLVRDLARDGVDYLGLPLSIAPRDWPWLERHLEVYDEAEILLAYSQASIFSQRGMRLLRDRRLEMARQFESGALSYWPNNECFLPTEIHRAGMRFGSLTDYGRAAHFNWWPPLHESELPAIRGEAFFHPVLEGERYARSVLRHEPRFLSVFSAGSVVRTRLSKLPEDFYRPFIGQEFKRRLTAAVKRRLAKVGLSPHWSKGAESPKARERRT